MDETKIERKDLKIFTSDIEKEAINQINLLLVQEPFKDCKVRIMPDVHAGKGCVIGFTADLGDKVIPNIVGVDIGCGMLCVNLGHDELNLEKLDKVINENIPAGRNIRENKLINFDKINDLYCLRELKETKKFNRAIGTLGGGNHFIEVDVDEEDNKYLVIHTGSRNLGKQVADYYQNLAIELCSGKEEMFKRKEEIIKTYKEQGRKSEIQKALKELESEYKQNKPELPNELCYLEGKYREMYLHDMKICQEYASLNRLQIAKEILMNYFQLTFVTEIEYPPIMEDRFETIHNYISFEDNVVRKGAIRANKGERVIIPINMRDVTFKERIIKHSFNIIDLIEVGDFVNENEVIDKYLFNGEIPVLETTGDETNAKCMCEGDIKTILTHEQYERNCYRLEDN